MIQTTVGALLDGELNYTDTLSYHIYIVSDGEVVFYVGKSTDVYKRLMGHIGRGEDQRRLSGTSSLGQFIIENEPQSREWRIELMAPEDWELIIGTCDPVDVAEQALIYVLRPCLNRTYNRHPSPIPDRYKTPWDSDGEGATRAVLAVFASVRGKDEDRGRQMALEV